MHRFSLLLSCSLLLLLLPTCDSEGIARFELAPASMAPERASAGLAASESVAAPSETRQDERMLIHRGELGIEVARPAEAIKTFLARIKELGGHLAKQQSLTLIVRVPAQHFDAAFATASAMGRVLLESREANDVTEEFVDLGIRLDTARKARDRLLEVLQKAERIEDILKVEAELRRLTEEIERLEGRRKFLADQVAMATLSVTFQAPTAPPLQKRQVRHGSRFGWINLIGAEPLMEQF
jgi:Domain of unknown function (DUF4349)